MAWLCHHLYACPCMFLVDLTTGMRTVTGRCGQIVIFIDFPDIVSFSLDAAELLSGCFERHSLRVELVNFNPSYDVFAASE